MVKLKYIGHFFGWVLLAVNALLAVSMMVCAYSPYINPVVHPVLACAGLAFPIFLLLNVLFLLFWLVIYRRYALLSLVALVACAGAIRAYIPINASSDEIPEGAFKLLSYNAIGYDSDKPHTKESPNEIVTYLLNSDADIICVQEAVLSSGQSSNKLTEKTLRKAMAAYPHYVHSQVGTSALDCFSRFPILSTRKVDYESSGNGSVMYEIKMGEDTLLLINNHLESNKLTADDKEVYKEMIVDPEKEKVKSGSRQLLGKVAEAVSIRAAQADSVAKIVRETPHKYVVVCGDFNDSPVSYTHRVIADGLNDAFVDSGCGPGISYNRNGFYFRIDHILNSDALEALNCTVDRSIKASDHYPIWCYLRKR